MTNSTEKKPVWQYAKEARERKATAAGESAKKPIKPNAGAVSKGSEEISVKVSNPDVDFNAQIIPMKFLKRAGVKTYAGELKERLLDVEEAPDGAYFLLPVKLPKKVYKKLLLAAIEMEKVSPDWTERDMIEAIIIFSKTKP